MIRMHARVGRGWTKRERGADTSSQPTRCWLSPWVAGLTVLLVMGLFTSQAHAAGDRVALLIGNSGYADQPLRNPGNDVRLMDSTLKALGFQVQRLEDASFSQMQRAVREFGARAQGAEVALVYYAGHGLQLEGDNWLVPVGAQIDKPADVSGEAVSASVVLRQLEAANPRVGLVILDACRNNPFAGRARSVSRGLLRMDAPTGTIVAYAAQPGAVADDGTGQNGLYTRHLAHYLRQPGLDIKMVFEQTAIAVERDSGGRQRPREDIGLRGAFYLAGSGRVEPPALAASPSALPPVIGGVAGGAIPLPVVIAASQPAPRLDMAASATLSAQSVATISQPASAPRPGGAGTAQSTPGTAPAAGRVAADCAYQHWLSFGDQGKRCMTEFPALLHPPGLADDWVPRHGFYSVALSTGPASCSGRIGVASNVNSSFHVYQGQRDEEALRQCRRALEALGSTQAAGCSCQVLIRDGAVSLEQSTLAQLLSRSGGS